MRANQNFADGTLWSPSVCSTGSACRCGNYWWLFGCQRETQWQSRIMCYWPFGHTLSVGLELVASGTELNWTKLSCVSCNGSYYISGWTWSEFCVRFKSFPSSAANYVPKGHSKHNRISQLIVHYVGVCVCSLYVCYGGCCSYRVLGLLQLGTAGPGSGAAHQQQRVRQSLRPTSDARQHFNLNACCHIIYVYLRIHILYTHTYARIHSLLLLLLRLAICLRFVWAFLGPWALCLIAREFLPFGVFLASVFVSFFFPFFFSFCVFSFLLYFI